jgi:hypothetical protein
LIFILALAARLIYLASIPQQAVLESVDARGYDLLARNLIAGNGFSLQEDPPYQPDGLRTPLYPVLIAITYTSVGERPIAVALVQAVLDSVTALIVGVIVSALLGTGFGFAAAILYALTPVQWRYAATVLPEVPLAFLVALSVWLLTHLLLRQGRPAYQEPRAGNLGSDRQVVSRSTSRVKAVLIAVACGIIAGLAALTKPNLAALSVILAGAALALLKANRRRALVSAAAILLAAAAAISPWIIRNWIVFERPFLSNANLGFVARVVAPATLGDMEGHQVPPWSPEWEARYHSVVAQAAERHDWQLDTTPSSPAIADERERQIADAAWDVIMANPWRALRAHLVGFARSWSPLEQTFWYTQLSGRPWEATGVPPNGFRDAIEVLLDGRPIEALDIAFLEPWALLDPLARFLWYLWGLGHVLGIALITLGVWQLRDRPSLALAFAAIILYATLPPGPIGYVRFRVPVMPVIATLEVAGIALLLRRLLTSRREAMS